MIPRLKEKYKKEVVAKLVKSLALSNVMECPRIEKVVINMGLGDAVQNIKVVDAAVAELQAISGQKPVVTKAKKAIASFKLRKGLPIGAMVTLRGNHMFEFLDRLFSVALPRVRDFKGISAKGFDGRGNFTFGIKEQIIFPEVNYDRVDKIRGMNITIVMKSKQDAHSLELLKSLGLPFRV